MDATYLKPGQNFNDLPVSYVIFICTYDPFDSGLYRYTYEEQCKETGECLGDGTCKIYLNTKGTNDADVPGELIHFLNYVETSTKDYAEESGDEKIQELHRKVEILKKSRRLEESYMTMEELLADREAAGREVGKAEGCQLMLELITLMTKDGLAGDITRLGEDEAFCKSMLKKYHLE